MDMRSTLFCSSLIISTAVMGTAAHAEGLYVLAAGGVSKFNLDVSRNDFSNVLTDADADVTSASLDTRDAAYKLQLGYQFNENFAIEGGYIDLGETLYSANYTDIVSASGKSSAALEVKGFNLDALLTLPINAGFSIFFKGGLLLADIDGSWNDYPTNGTVASSQTFSTSETKVRPNFGFGVAYNFVKHLSVRAEVERFGNLWLKSDDELAFDVKADIDLYSLGLSYQF